MGVAGAAAADRDNSSAKVIAIAITVTTDVADAISVDAGDNAAAVVDRHNSRDSAANRVSAHHSLRSYRTVKRRAGSIRSATAVSFAEQQIVISPSPAMRTCRRR